MITYKKWASIVAEVPEQDRLNFIKISLKDKKNLHIFARHYFPEQITGEICDMHLDLCNEISKPKDSAIIVPRGHGKTTWTRIDLIHDIVYQLEPFIVLIGYALGDAMSSFSYIRAQLESNQLLIKTYGDLVPKFSTKKKRKWTDRHIETNHRVTLLAFGKGKGRGLNYQGNRPTKCLVDDMEDQQEVKNEEIRKKDRKWLYQTLLPAMDKDRGKIKMIGTVLHFDCLLLKFLDDVGGIRRAAIEDEKKQPSLDGKPIWFTMEQLDKYRRMIGSFGFAQEYMNDPSTDENSDVKERWIKRVDNVQLVDSSDKQLYYIFSALDPSVGASQTSDESAIATVALRIGAEEVDITVLSCEHGRWNLTRTVQEAKRVFDRYMHKEFGVEVVAFQEHLREICSKNGIPAQPIKVSKDKRARLQEIVGYIEFGNIKFSKNTEDLITQLIQFPNAAHDDRVDAFVHAVKMALKYVGGGFVPTMI